MKKRILKNWVKNVLCIESTLLFSFVAMVDDFTFIGFIILICILFKLLINIKILDKYTNIFDMEV